MYEHITRFRGDWIRLTHGSLGMYGEHIYELGIFGASDDLVYAWYQAISRGVRNNLQFYQENIICKMAAILFRHMRVIVPTSAC